MKIILPLLSAISIFLTTIAAAQTNTNRWKETTRLDEKKKEISYTDTFYINMQSGDDVLMRRGSFVYKGTFHKKQLEFADRIYKVVERNHQEIRLQDELGIISVFTPDAVNLSNDVIAKDMQANELPTATITDLNPVMIQGKWTAYKRSTRDGKPLVNIDYNAIIKTIVILSAADSAGNLGYAYNNAQGEGEYIYSISQIANGVIMLKGKNNNPSTLNVIKSDEKEWYAEGEDKVVYFFRR